MASENTRLRTVFDGWDGYQQSLVAALRPLTVEQLSFRLSPDQRSVGEIAAHIAFGRLDWFSRMSAPGTAELVEQAAPYWQPWGAVNEAIHTNGPEIIHWLEATWGMIERNLAQWTIDDLKWSYRQPYGGKVYLVSRQWVIWRIMAHDIHHGGQLSLLLMAQGIEVPELVDNGGHIIEVPEEGSEGAKTRHTPDLYYLASCGRVSKLKEHLDVYPEDINLRDQYQFTPLHGAVDGDDLRTVMFLLERGADVNAQNDQRVAPLHMAGSQEIIDALVAAGAEVNVTMMGGDTPLHTLLLDAHSDDSLVQCFLDHSADKSLRNDKGQLPLDIARARKRHQAIQLLSAE